MNKHEILDIVDENDKVIGSIVKKYVYEKGLSNRIVHIFVIHPETGDIYIQKRGPNVGYLPNHLGPSAGGHVSSGEDYDIAAIRELKEEIGLYNKLELINKFIYSCPETNPSTDRFISLYVTYASKGFEFSDHEVADGFFVSKEKLAQLINKNEHIHPQLGPCFHEYMKYCK